MDRSIASAFASSLGQFIKLSLALRVPSPAVADQLPLSMVQDELGRLKIWAGNIAAHRNGKVSLDHRLRDATPLRGRIVSLLDDMSEILQEAIAIVSGTRPARNNADFDSGSDSELSIDEARIESESHQFTELQQIFQDVVVVVVVVDCLYRLSMSIRNGVSNHDRLIKAASIDISFYEAWDVNHVKAKFPAVKHYLCLRLGKALSRRRQYFKYCEKHHKKLAQDLIEPNIKDVHAHALPRTQGPDEPIDSAAAKTRVDMSLQNETVIGKRSVAANTILTGTSASEFVGADIDVETKSDSGQTLTSYASSASFGGRLAIPPLPSGSTGGRPFECPYCYTMVGIKSQNAWKKHIFRDLQPYICTFESCFKARKTFKSRHDWWDHELNEHRKVWSCAANCQAIFHSQAEFEKHVRETHMITSNQQISALADVCHRPVDGKTEQECPLCLEVLDSLQQLCRHLARHLEELALFSLPRDRNEEGQDDDSDKPQQSKSKSSGKFSQQYESSSSSTDVNSLYESDDESGFQTSELISSFIFVNRLHDAERLLMLDRLDRRLFYRGEVERLTKEPQDPLNYALLFDNCLILATKSIDHKYEITCQPIRIELLVLLDQVNDEYQWKLLPIQEGEAKEGAIAKTPIQELFPLFIRDISTGDICALVVKSASQRKKWWDNIQLAQQAMSSRTLFPGNSDAYSLTLIWHAASGIGSETAAPQKFFKNQIGIPKSLVLFEDKLIHLAPTFVECVTPFYYRGRGLIAMSSSTDFYVFDPAVPSSPALVYCANIDPVTQITVLEGPEVMLVLASNNLYVIDIMNGFKLSLKLLENVKFFRFAKTAEGNFIYCITCEGSNESLSLIEIYHASKGRGRDFCQRRAENPPELDKPLLFKGYGYCYWRYAEYYLRTPCSQMHVFDNMCIVFVTDSSFKDCSLISPPTRTIPISLPREPYQSIKGRPLEIFSLPEGTTRSGVLTSHLCVYECVAIYIDRDAEISDIEPITFVSKATAAALDSHYLFIFHDEFFEIWDVITGLLCRIVTGLSVKYVGSDKGILVAMQHAESEGRDSVFEFVLTDESQRMKQTNTPLTFPFTVTTE